MCEEEIRDAAIGRIGADRMEVGLGSIPNKIAGDLEKVKQLQTENKELKEEKMTLVAALRDAKEHIDYALKKYN